jgi:hypothetical protein
MENEFRRVTVRILRSNAAVSHLSNFFAQLTCDGAYVVPRNTGNATKYPYEVYFYRVTL